MFVPGIPAMVPGVTVDNNTININGNIVTLTLSWAEPFNNFDPIVNYTVSCSGDVTCPPNFTTTDNTTRNYTITNLTTMTTYTFSVVATNSIGSEGTGTVDFTTPYKVIIATTSESMAPSQNIIATIQSLGMINTSSEGTTNTTSSVGMTTTTSSVGMTSTTSSVGMTSTTTPNEDMTTIPTSEGVTTSYFTSFYM